MDSKGMLDIIIVDAGPSGLATAIAAKKHGVTYPVIEKGSVVDAIRRFPVQMTFFSTPELLEIGGVPFITSTFRPSRTDIVRYYHRVAKEFGLDIRTGSQVTSIEKENGTFTVRADGESFRSRNVVFATGYFDNPNPFNIPGSDLPKVMRYYSEPYLFSGKRIAVVGGKNSAVELALDLFRNGAAVTLIHRGARLSEGVKYWILPDIENRIKAGEINALFGTTVARITRISIVLQGQHAGEIPNDFVFVMIGYQPDNTILQQAGVRIEPESQAPIHDAVTMETNVPGLYVAGSIAAGKFNNKIFIENGRMHGGLIVDSVRKKLLFVAG
jgi:thioredoxin reductase (NADPH)